MPADFSIIYQRPDLNLQTLRDEVYAAYGQPKRPAEFVTGYKSPDNFTGHNPDNNGIAHAVDLFTDDNGNIPQAAGRALADRIRLIGRATSRFQYLIHDMSPGAPAAKIASANTGWEWVPYDGPDTHSDHIHVSTVDCYWGYAAVFYGTNTPVPASYYDNAAPWGIADAAVQSGGVTVLPERQLLVPGLPDLYLP